MAASSPCSTVLGLLLSVLVATFVRPAVAGKAWSRAGHRGRFAGDEALAHFMSGRPAIRSAPILSSDEAARRVHDSSGGTAVVAGAVQLSTDVVAASAATASSERHESATPEECDKWRHLLAQGEKIEDLSVKDVSGEVKATIQKLRECKEALAVDWAKTMQSGKDATQANKEYKTRLENMSSMLQWAQESIGKIQDWVKQQLPAFKKEQEQKLDEHEKTYAKLVELMELRRLQRAAAGKHLATQSATVSSEVVSKQNEVGGTNTGVITNAQDSSNGDAQLGKSIVVPLADAQGKQDSLDSQNGNMVSIPAEED